MKYSTVAAAVLLLVGFALIAPAQVRGGVSAAAAPTAISTSAPGLGAQPAASPMHNGGSPAGKNSAALSPIDHVLIIRARPALAPPAAESVGAAAHAAGGATPQAAATGAEPAVSGQTPSARPQPVAKLTPGVSALASARAPAPAATPGLSPIDHSLWVSVHPPTAPPSNDHSVPETDHKASDNWILTPGEELLASLNLPLGAHLTEGEVLLDHTRDDSFLEPINWSVIVHKSSYILDVYYKGRLFGSFPAVFGRNPDHSAKMWEGDLRTPEGVYAIVEKFRDRRWRWFLRLNYPNSHDRMRYDTMLDEGLVPVLHGHYRPLGGAIGIHGTDRPRFNRLDLNWTLGCISLQNNAIDELARILPVGTMVIIKGKN